MTGVHLKISKPVQGQAPSPAPSAPPPRLFFPGVNRRQHHRFNVDRAGKIFRRTTQSYVPARTRNLSIGGALVELEAPRSFQVGEVVDLGVAYRHDAVVREHAMLQAIVMRVEQPVAGDSRRAGKQLVALRYINPHHASQAA